MATDGSVPDNRRSERKFFSGMAAAIQGVVRGVGPFGIDPRRFLIVPLFAVGLFAVFVVAGIRARRDPQRHKRLMLLATIALFPHTPRVRKNRCLTSPS